MRIALIVSYYNRPDLLDLCLHSVSLQTRKPDEVILIDDGSDQPLWDEALIYTKDCFSPAELHDMRPGVSLEVNDARDIQHLARKAPKRIDLYLRQPHNGFGKQRLLNKAIMETRADYLIVLDQDCVVPPDFIETHERIAKWGQYVCGMYTSLDPDESNSVTKERISNGWIWDKITRAYEGTPHIWCGAGSAVCTEDALMVNGFDTRFGWCGGDYNFGLRLAAAELSWDHFSKYGRYFHLWHEKPWAADKKDWLQGDRTTANENARKWAAEAVTEHGIRQQDMSMIEVIR